jgi:RNA polymerase sigma factor (sigma-70 family)
MSRHKNPLAPEREAALVRAAQAGDLVAESELYEAYRPLLLRCARDVAGREELDDATQMAAVWFLERVRGHREEGVPLWLLVRQKLKGHLAGRLGRQSLCAETGFDLPEPADDEKSGVESAELGSLVIAAVARLKPRDAQIVRLHFVEGLDWAEVSRRVGYADPRGASQRFYDKSKAGAIVNQLRRSLTLEGVRPDAAQTLFDESTLADLFTPEGRHAA